jgi:hypothetical protein
VGVVAAFVCAALPRGAANALMSIMRRLRFTP